MINGRLGVRRIREFNLTLLDKWCWRLREEIRSLWIRVLAARYRKKGGCIGDGGRRSSGRWNNLNSIKGGRCAGVGRWFDDNLCWKVGDDVDTLFWWDPWLEEGVLKSRFSLLFYLANNKMMTVEYMNTLGWSEDGEAWNGKRRLLAWEEEQVRECCELLHYFVLQADVADRWLWQLNKSKIYNVYSAYNYLLIIDHKLTTNHTNIIRHKEAPLKFTIFA